MESIKQLCLNVKKCIRKLVLFSLNVRIFNAYTLFRTNEKKGFFTISKQSNILIFSQNKTTLCCIFAILQIISSLYTPHNHSNLRNANFSVTFTVNQVYEIPLTLLAIREIFSQTQNQDGVSDAPHFNSRERHISF